MLLMLLFAVLLPSLGTSEMYFDINSYTRFDQGKVLLAGAERRIVVSFRYCNHKGVLFYQSGQDGYFALGVNSNKIYIEWKTSNIVVELYVGNGNLQANATNTVIIDSLSNRQYTTAYVNGRVETVDYLIVLDETLDFGKLSGELFVGGFVDVSLLPMNTERLSAYLITCIDYIETANGRINLTNYNFATGIFNNCPSDFCAPPSIITTTTTSSFVHMNVTVKSRTQTQISFRFRTKDSQGLLFFIGGPAYLSLFLVNGGRLGLGLNTRGTEPGAYNYSSLGGFNDGRWKYVQVTRSNNVANVTNDVGYLLASTRFGSSEESGFNMNAESLYMAGAKNPLTFLPAEAQTSTSGCFEAPRFVSFSIASEPASLLSYQTQIKESRDIKADGCFSADTCSNSPCLSPSQICNFKCECAPGFYVFTQTPLACLNINDCASNPCAGNSNCTDLIFDYRCVCSPQYTGKNCEQVNYCFNNPCGSGGVCATTANSFVCTCNAGFTGVRCETDIDECVSSPCRNGAICINEAGRFSCQCRAGFTGVTCNDDVNECLGNPCRNGGVCANTFGSFSCSCAAGWTGANCEQEIDECVSNPCQNGAVCFNNIGFYRCACVAGFTGTNCETDVNECVSNPCQNGGVCINAVNSYSCSCAPGFSGSNCEVNVNECLSQPCRNGGQCRDGVNSFTCQCSVGYTGVFCEVDIDECLSRPCLNGGVCQNNAASFSCVCAPGYFGTTCEQMIDRCNPQPCRNGGVCVNSATTFTCNCPPGLVGLICDTNVNECASNPCLNGAPCVDLTNSYRCDCLPGYQGSNCGVDIDECTLPTGNPCENGGTCLNLIGRFECRCLSGYNGPTCNTNINECASSPCQNGVCIDRINYFECQCSPGFNGNNCQFNIDECLSRPCQNSGICIDQVNSYVCQCVNGYSGVNCEVNVNECVSSPCRNGGVCQDLVGAFRCLCPTGFEGTLCEMNINDCLANRCQNGGRCVDGLNQYTCECAQGWSGQFCEQDINECASNPCANNAPCQNLIGRFQCLCPVGLQGVVCNEDIDECALKRCVNSVSCTNTFGSFVCVCSPGFTGPSCDLTRNQCRDQPCYFGGICTDLPTGGYSCQCAPNFMGSRCEAVIRFCNFTKPCGPQGSCTDLEQGGYTCNCNAGYTGADCQTEVNECASNPCANGGVCFDLVYMFRCLCPAGFMGPRCLIDVDECASFPCKNEGICSTPSPNMYLCTCRPGYEGKNCEYVIDNCRSNPCNNRQRCSSGINSFTCSCVEGFEGPQCSQRSDQCLSSPCKNGGLCTSSTGDSFFCTCPPPFFGRTCDVSDDVCNPNPCLHLGVCIRNSQASGGYTCTCRPGFIGQRCQGDVYDCLSNPCQNGGTCVDAGGLTSGYVCRCLANYGGVNCERLVGATTPPSSLNPCFSFPCLNQGTCFPITSTDYRCNCLSGWTGQRCAENVNECLPINPCQNGGSCIDNAGSYACSCINGWSGFSCSIPPSNPCNLNPCPGQICQPTGNGLYVCCPQGSLFCPNPCSSTPCLNGATCNALSTTTFACQCTTGVQGDRCQIVLMATFNGNNFVQIPTPPSSSSSSPSSSSSSSSSSSEAKIRMKRQNVFTVRSVKSLTLTFVTNLNNGLILFATGSVQNDRNEYMLFEMFGSKLRTVVGFQNQTVSNHFDISQNLRNKTFTTISIRIASKLLAASIRPCFSDTTTSTTSGSSSVPCSFNTSISWDSLDLGGPIYFGAVPTWTNFLRSKVKSSQNFKGCMGLLKINEVDVSIIASQASLITVLKNEEATEKSIPGCVVPPDCSSDFCENGGACLDLWFERKCVCAPSYAGLKCERQQLVHLSGSPTFAYQRVSQSALSNTSIEFELTSNRSSGFVLYTLSSIQVGIFLENWILIFVLWLPGNPRTIDTKVNLESKTWFGISLSIREFYIDLTVTPSGSTSPAFQQRITSEVVISLGRVLYIGSLFQNSSSDSWRNIFPNINPSIIGCVRTLKIDGTILDLGRQNIAPLDNPVLLEITRKCPREEGCLADTCSSNGLCIPSWQGKTCNCYPSFVGPACAQLSSSTYNGVSSFSNLTIDSTVFSFGSHLSFDMRTRQNDSCVIHVQLLPPPPLSPTSTCFLVSSGFFGLSIKSASALLDMTMMTKFQVASGQWTVIKVHFYDNIVNVTQDSTSQFFNLNTNILTSPPYNTVSILAGAGIDSNGAPSRFFKGCLRNVNLNEHSGPVSLQSGYSKADEGILSVTTQGGVVGDCVGDDVCASRPCSSSGTCVDLWNSFECQCRDGWVGAKCEQLSTTCASNLCINFVRCVDEAGSYRCECKPGWKGVYCAEASSACDSLPCLNGGVCSQGVSGAFTCACLNGFVGQRCDQDVNECASAPCSADSLCVDGRGSFSCVCPAWLQGPTCSVRNFCGLNPCRNNATCLEDTTKNFTCVCAKGFSGERCESFNPCFSNPCKNNGTCSQIAGEFRCACLSPFQGETCESTDPCSPNPCLNGAVCASLRVDAAVTFRCTCLSGFYGRVCDRLDSCTSTPCLTSRTCPDVDPSYTCPCTRSSTTPICSTLASSCNQQFTFCVVGGDCLWNETSLKPYCSCREGYSGSYCNLLVDPCALKPCMNGGTCVVATVPSGSSGGTPTYQCACKSGFTGGKCEASITDSCSSNPCKFNSSCTNQAIAPLYTCSCGQFLSGPNCEVCSYCSNGGHCLLTSGVLSCDCSSTNHTGVKCETQLNPCVSNPCTKNEVCTVLNGSRYACNQPIVINENTNALGSSRPDTGVIVGLAVGLPLVLLALLGLFCLFRREQKLRGAYKPAETTPSTTLQAKSNTYAPPFTISRSSILT